MALETHPTGLKGIDMDNLSLVVGVKVEIKKAKRYDDGKGSKGEGRGKERQKGKMIFFRKVKNRDTRTN